MQQQQHMDGHPPRKPLAGVKVLDFTRALSGPFCSMALGDLGADIVKVEPLDGGDMTRTLGAVRKRAKRLLSERQPQQAECGARLQACRRACIAPAHGCGKRCRDGEFPARHG